MFQKLEEALELLNSSDSDESDVEIAVFSPDASEQTDEDEGYENEVNAVYDLIVKETMRYAAYVKNEHGFLTTVDEVHIFIGILFLTGYHSKTCERDYWPDAEDLGIAVVKNVIHRNHFQKLKSYLHFVDNATVSQHAQDRSFKESPHPWRQTEESAKPEQDGAKRTRQWRQGNIAG
ncbi:piggyBac transposable element-derived protein 2 [Trichonephila clavipes]|nr:piggyBac transposable element-derived protein 2 [Trichonephila clavipes]